MGVKEVAWEKYKGEEGVVGVVVEGGGGEREELREVGVGEVRVGVEGGGVSLEKGGEGFGGFGDMVEERGYGVVLDGKKMVVVVDDKLGLSG